MKKWNFVDILRTVFDEATSTLKVRATQLLPVSHQSTLVERMLLTNVPLAASGEYYSDTIFIGDYRAIKLTLFFDNVSGAELHIWESEDGVNNWIETASYSAAPEYIRTEELIPTGHYIMIQVVNQDAVNAMNNMVLRMALIP